MNRKFSIEEIKKAFRKWYNHDFDSGFEWGWKGFLEFLERIKKK